MILLTGASGFLGQEILKLDHKVKGIYRSYNNQKGPFSIVKRLDKNTEFYDVFDNVESVIHLAGVAHSKVSHISEYQEVNVEGTLNLAQQAVDSGVKRFVFVSSIGVNGTETLQEPFSTKSKPCPKSLYAKSKLDAELGLKRIAKDTGMELVIVRPTLVYGRNAPGNFGALTRLVSRTPVLPFGMIDNKRDFISVQNLAHLLVVCTEHPKAAGRTFLASEGETVSIREFTNSIAEALDKSLVQLPVPEQLLKLGGKLFGKSAMIDQLVGNLQVDSSNLQEILGWNAPFSMKEALSSL